GPFSWEKCDGRYQFSPQGGEDGGDSYMLRCYPHSRTNILQFVERDRNNANAYDRRFLIINDLPANGRTIDCIGDAALRELAAELFADSFLLNNAQERRLLQERMKSVLPQWSLGDARRERLARMAAQGELAEDTISLIATNLFESSEGRRKLVSAIIGNDEYLRALHPLAKEEAGYSRITQQLEAEKNEELRELDQQIEQKKKELDSVKHALKIAHDKHKKLPKGKKNKKLRNAPAAADLELAEADEAPEQPAAAEAPAEIARAGEQLQELADHIAELQKQSEAWQQRALQEQDAYRQSSLQMQRQHQELLDRLEKEQQSILGQFQDKLQKAYASIAFDGPIASSVMQAAAGYAEQRRRAIRHTSVLTLEKASALGEISPCATPRELAEFMTQELNERACRNIAYNDVANLLLCLSQGFLTILTGMPGSGKSSLAADFARLLGLDSPSRPRYHEIATERGWISRREFIGSYNPMTCSFEASQSGIYDCLADLNAEAEQNIAAFPYLILLDEANLSPMEHYWADFMRISDLHKRDRRIALGTGCELAIGPQLRFIATVNIDNTTEMLSPRLLDRAWTVIVPSQFCFKSVLQEGNLREEYPLVPFNLLNQLNDPASWVSAELDDYIEDYLGEIEELCDRYGFALSPRSQGMLRRYCLAAKGFIDTSANGFAAFDYAIAQKLLPQLNGYGSSYRDFLQRLIKGKETAMPVCRDTIDQLLGSDQSNMQSYRFFGR
ncbi:hypothetical protein IJT17_03585, partial [bacterium]|nr:hypothetical protein [bacterium]